MSRTAILGAPILAGDWLDDHAVLIEGAHISAIVPASAIPPDFATVRVAGGMIVPGFIDTQVNGGGDVLFNDVPTVEGLREIAAAHRRFGTTGLMPTLISDDLVVMKQGIAAVEEAIAQGVPGILGIHLEGPFLNPGKHGIHDAGRIRLLDTESVALLTSLRRGKTLVTLAPERTDAGLIRTLSGAGVIVAAGHSLATYEEMGLAVAAGLSGVTHLFNAMTQLESRAPGVVGAAFDHPLTSGLIVDGHHVHPAALRAAYAVCGTERLMLVTDAMPPVGGDLASFRLGDQDIRVEDGALKARDGTLAGSVLDMASAVRNAVTMMGVDWKSALEMASSTPARFLGLQGHGRIAPGYRADLVHLDAHGNAAAVWVGGERY